MNDPITIRFDGRRHGFWQRVSIRASIDDLCAALSLSLGGPGAGAGLGIGANTVIEVLIGEDKVTTARVDSLRREVSDNSHSIEIGARSLGRELVDCRYSKTLSGLTLEAIMARICGAFEVPLRVSAQTAVTPAFSMQCESPAGALINAARATNLLLYPTPDGGLVLQPPTSAAPVATLIHGEHLRRYQVTDEFNRRFSEYFLKGYDHGADAALDGKATDDGIGFFRPMEMIADRHGRGTGGCGRRARLERDRRRAAGRYIEVELPGWRRPDGGLWGVNMQARVILPQEGVDDVFLIGACELRHGADSGSVTRLRLMARDALKGEAT
uniref:Mu-like prophage tail protein gpP n=1 Tax=Candidatus Kentrum sp. LPFa TaxID=2126335 RepID=A0A450WMA1_9GAMM|nr:MAG: Mu-like prophage tail protein gpP [Candidatus Kentron sp. LPFa]